MYVQHYIIVNNINNLPYIANQKESKSSQSKGFKH